MSNDNVCPVCGTAGLVRDSAAMEFEYKGATLVADVFFHYCDACGAEVGIGDDQRDTGRAQHRARKVHDGLLLGSEIRAIRNQLKLTQAKAQELFGGGPVSFSKYENDEVMHSKLLDVTLRMVSKDEAYLEAYAKEAGVVLPYRKLARIAKGAAKVYEVRAMQLVGVGDPVSILGAAAAGDYEHPTMRDYVERGQAPRSLLAARYAAQRGF